MQRGVRLRHADIQAQARAYRRCGTAPGRCRSPAVMSWPTSVLRAVTTPSNGATIRWKPDEIAQPLQVGARGLQLRIAGFG